MMLSRHKAIAQTVVSTLGKDRVSVEKRFDSIRRIADLVWNEKKIIFEIQCSLIEPSEVLSRMRDYESLGYDVIWLLDDKKFNQRHLTKAEVIMRSRGGKYVSLSENRCMFYDQVEQCEARKQIQKTPSYKINIANPYLRIHSGLSLKPIPKPLTRQWSNARHIFPGSVLDLLVQDKLTLLPSTKRHYFAFCKRIAVRAKKYIAFFLNYYIRHTYKGS